MSGDKSLNGKKKSLGHITSIAAMPKNSIKYILHKNPSTLSYQHQSAKPATNKRKIINKDKDKTLGEAFFAKASSSFIGARSQNSGLATKTPTNAQAIINYNKAVSLIRIAIADCGGISDPKRNLRLGVALKRAKEFGVTQATLQQIIRKSKLLTEARPVALLQIRYQGKVFVVCTVLTRSQSEFQLQLMPTLKKHFAGFAPVVGMFNSETYIEAIVPMDIGGDFRDLEKNVCRDGFVCGAKESKLKEYENGVFRFRVDAQIAADVAAGLLTKGYRIVNICYDFKPKRQVDLNLQEREAYNNFLWKLRQIPEIDGIFDNVRKSVATRAKDDDWS